MEILSDGECQALALPSTSQDRSSLRTNNRDKVSH